MARILFSGLVDSIAGKLAGSVIQNSYGGYQLRTRVVPRNPQSDTQQAVRNRFATISYRWRDLPTGYQDNWRNAIAPPIKGIQLFTSSNINAQLIGYEGFADWTEGDYPDPMPMIISTATTVSLQITLNGGAGVVPADTSLLIAATKQLQPGQIFFSPTSYSPIYTLAAGEDLTNPFELIELYESIIAPLVADQPLSIQVSAISTINGLRSVLTTRTAVIIAP